MLSAGEGERVRYLDHGVEKNALLHEQDRGVAVLSSSSSAAVKEYEDKLKAIELYQRGVEKAVVAERLSRSVRWVQKWWRQEPRLLPRPHGAQDRVFQKTPLSGFRDVELVRNPIQDPQMFDLLVNQVPWRQGKVMTRDSETGELVLRFDTQGNTIAASRKVADCPRGINSLDRALQKVFSLANIRDPQARVVLNFYEDGSKTLNSHRHDFWTCLVSLGSPRVLLVDNKPHIMEDGDMITFGTQMHGVPAMPDLQGGRISLVIFFYPDRDNLERRWLTILPNGEDAEDADLAHDGLSIVDLPTSTDPSAPYNCDCRTGSASSASVPGAAELSALKSAMDGTTVRDRPNWRKSNAELQFMEYPELPCVTIYSVGCSTAPMPCFLKLLLCHGIEALWDLRPVSMIKAAVRANVCGGHYLSENLREACRGCFRSCRHWPIGTAAAGGLSNHLFCTEEGATLIYRMCREAQQRRICFLGGPGTNWRDDDLRQSVGVALTRAGAKVVHLTLTADPDSSEHQGDEHPPDFELPLYLRSNIQRVQSTNPNHVRAEDHSEVANDVCHADASDLASTTKEHRLARSNRWNRAGRSS